MAAATAQGTYINPMTALAAGQLPHALNGMPNPVVPPTSGKLYSWLQKKNYTDYVASIAKELIYFLISEIFFGN